MSISEETRQKMIDDYVNHFLSIKELGLKYGITSYSYISKYILGKDIVRSPSKANKLAHKTKSERYKHSEETKKRMSLKHIEYIKNNPNKTAWRKRYSNLEEIFYKWIKDNNIDKKYLIYRQYPIYPYLIDFAFTDIKLAIEIDGTQHQLKKRQESDKRKDDLLLSKGWNVIRIKEKDIRNDCNSAFEIVNDKLKEYSNMYYSNVGIVEYKRNSIFFKK